MRKNHLHLKGNCDDMLRVCKSDYVQHEKELRPGVVRWSDILVLFCQWRWEVDMSHPVMTDLTETQLRSHNGKTARCVWPQLSSVHQRKITHLFTSHGFVQLFFILKAREMIDEYRGPGVSFLSVIRSPLSSQQEDRDWEVTGTARSARTGFY